MTKVESSRRRGCRGSLVPLSRVTIGGVNFILSVIEVIERF